LDAKVKNKNFGYKVTPKLTSLGGAVMYKFKGSYY